jgi:Protein of unknown function (DUF3313)
MKVSGTYMPKSTTSCHLRLSAAFVIFSTMVGCTSPEPLAYKGLSSAAELTAVKDDETPYRYSRPDADFCQYRKMIVDPVTIYDGPDAQFDSTAIGVSATSHLLDPVSQEDRTIVADYMRETFRDVLKDRFQIITIPEPNALRLHLTLTGIVKSMPVLSVISHVSPYGFAISAGQEAFDGKGSFFGYILYAVEIYDTESNKLVYAYVTAQTPDAMDITAGLGYLDAARTGVRIGAKHLRETLSKNGSVSCDLGYAMAK